MTDKLVFDNVSKIFGDGNESIKVLDSVSLKIKEGEFVAVLGPSGSGKSTFLSIAGALLKPSEGRILIGDEQLNKMTSKQMHETRLKKIGFVFQSANLIPYLTVLDQLILIGELDKNRKKDSVDKADRLLQHLDLTDRIKAYPENLSGGERQRVAIARAFMNDPEIILADEPTASLDSERGKSVVQMLYEEVKHRNKAAVMVTHDEKMTSLCDRIIYMDDGKMIE